MSYTDEEILDLEDSLDSVGHSVQVRLGIVEPDHWNQQEMGVFGFTLTMDHFDEVKDQGIILGSTHMLIPTLQERKGRSILTIQGPSIKAMRILNRLYEKYECQMAFEFPD